MSRDDPGYTISFARRGRSKNSTLKTSVEMQASPLLAGEIDDDVRGDLFPHDQQGVLNFDTSTSTGRSGNDSMTQSSHRILDRNGGYNQSLGKWQIKRDTGSVKSLSAMFGCCNDWFHSLLYKNTVKVYLYLCFVYVALIFFYAFVYLMVSKIGTANLNRHKKHDVDSDAAGKIYCGMSITNHMEALYFSLSTMTTIGYGVSDYYFGDCWLPLILVLAQVLTAILFDAVAIGVLFLRLSKPAKRARSVIFSDTAVIRRLKGKLYFIFQFGELRKQQLLESHVRIYCIRHHRYLPHNSTTTTSSSAAPKHTSQIQTSLYHTHPVDVYRPHNSKSDISLFMPLPNVTIHAIDSKSPLRPKRVWYDKNGKQHVRGQWKSLATSLCEHVSSDASVSTKSTITMSCASSVTTTDPSAATTTNYRTNAIPSPLPPDYGHEKIDQFINEEEEIKAFMRDREAELVVIVEGTDEMTGSAMQARHSYRWDDIFWNQTFAPCLSVVRSTGDGKRNLLRKCENMTNNKFIRTKNDIMDKCVIDFTKFHDLIPAPLDCDSDAILDFISEDDDYDE